MVKNYKTTPQVLQYISSRAQVQIYLYFTPRVKANALTRRWTRKYNLFLPSSFRP